MTVATPQRAINRRASGAVEEVHVRRHPSPFGELLLAATGAGIVRIVLPSEEREAALAGLREHLGAELRWDASPPLDHCARELDEYFAARRREFTVALDWRLVTGAFRRRALEAMAAIPYGQTLSYTEIAAAAGSPRAVRAAGSACATNPLPIIVPCHRVLRSDGSIGGYGGGLEMKRALLAMEAGQATV